MSIINLSESMNSVISDTAYTPEVVITQETSFLIRINGVESFSVETEADSKLIIDSIAAENVRTLQNDWTKVFRMDQHDGKKIVISIQALGIKINGSIEDKLTIDFIPIRRAKLLKGRLERQDRYNSDDILNLIKS